MATTPGTPNSPISKLLASGAMQIISVATIAVLLIVVGFSLIWDEIHGTPLTSTTSGLLNFLLGLVSSIIGIHVGSGVQSAAANQGITAVISPASLTVDSAGRPNGTHDIHTSQSSTGGPEGRTNVSSSGT